MLCSWPWDAGPFTQGLGLETVGVTMTDHGFIQTDNHFKTSNGLGIYAIGDVIGGAMLAHKAEDEGVVLAEILAGQAGHIDYDAIPGIVYTWPEAAGLGQTEEKLKEAGVTYKVGKFPFSRMPAPAPWERRMASSKFSPTPRPMLL